MSTENQQSDDEIDVEAYAKSKKPVPPGKKYRIRIDKPSFVVDVDHMTGLQILALAGKTPDKFILQQKIGAQVTRVEPAETVSFLHPGVERFMTIPKEVTEGEGPLPRRHFDLMPDDEAYLASLNRPWEAVLEAGVRRVVLKNWPLPEGYGLDQVDINVRLEVGYPDAQIDMAYFSPHLQRADKKAIGALSSDNFDGKDWQRWSRHRTAGSAWRIGEDNLSTHMALVNNWLCEELRK